MIIERIIGFIAPHHCLSCGNEGALLCENCANELPWVPARDVSGFPWNIYAATSYGGLAKRLVHALKFEYARMAARDIGRIMARRLPEDCRPHVVTYVPTATSRVRQRGYDHAQLVARVVARELGAPCLPALARLGQQRQVGQDKQLRSKQMQQAFRPVRKLPHRHVLLVDDVLTTGSTVRFAAATLYASGAERVDVAVFAATSPK